MITKAQSHHAAHATDQALHDAIVARWEEDNLIRVMLYYAEIRVRVEAGTAILEGNGWSPIHREHLEEVTRRVPGVREVRNELILDPELKMRVAEAVEDDPRTRNCTVVILSHLGKVRLEGEAPDLPTREAAGTIAAEVPGVRKVVNMLRVPTP